MDPTPDNVSAIIIEEIMKWKKTGATELERRDDLTSLSERLIRYFAIFYAQPQQLDGLPGGHAHEAAELALGRRNASKRALLSGSTGLVLP
jgi:hypothetical protein